jgi:hypothetical protein
VPNSFAKEITSMPPNVRCPSAFTAAVSGNKYLLSKLNFSHP